jgi:hypothetical protein
MSLKIVIPGADFSAIGNPKVKSLLYGFPADGLAALYLMEDGAAGSVPTQLLDSSGKSNHAPLRTGSSILKTAEGVRSDVVADAVSKGWVAKTPITHDQSFTRICVVRDRSDSVNNAFVLPFGFPTGDQANMDATPWGQPGAAAGNQLHLLTNGSAGTNRRPQGYAIKAGTTNKWDAFTGATFNLPSTPIAEGVRWQVNGVSYNKVTGRFIWMGAGGSFDLLVGQDGIDWMTSVSGLKHAFSNCFYVGAGASITKGDTALGALYQGFAMEPSDLQFAMSAARARVAMRGIVAV